jgi:hypothetical protein
LGSGGATRTPTGLDVPRVLKKLALRAAFGFIPADLQLQ